METKISMKPRSIVLALFRLFGHISIRRRWQLTGLLILMLFGAAAELATFGAVIPFLALLADKTIVQKYAFLEKILVFCGWNGNGSIVILATGIFVATIVLATVLRIILSWASLKFSFGLGADIGVEVYRRTLYQPYSFHVAHNTSEIISGLNKVQIVVYSVLSPVVQGLVSLTLATVIFVALIRIDLVIALVATILFATLYLVVTLVFQRRLLDNSKIIAANETLRVQAMQEGLGGIRDVLIDGTQIVYIDRFQKIDVSQRRAQAFNNFISGTPRFLIECIGMVFIALLAFWLSQREGGLSTAIPYLGALAIGAQKLIPQMQLLYSSWSSLASNYAVLLDVLGLLDLEIPEEYLLPAPRQIMVDPLKSIRLCNLSFRYRSDSTEVITKINLEITRGQRVGFIGKTGSGKSTLIDLITGLLEPSDGMIEIDGERLTSDNRRSWQSRIAHVPQTIYLADGNIAQNIAFGVETQKIDMERVRESACKARLAEFVEELPLKYLTSVGERGVQLSGGQRQRIGIARALYKNAAVFMLDEATSALDDATETSVMEGINDLEDDITILMIAHRLSTLKNCDCIYELINGHIVGHGSFESMIHGTSKSSRDSSANRI